MAVYSLLEIHEILIKLSQDPQIDVKYLKFPRLGILVSRDKDEGKSENNDKQNSYQCCECKKKLISARKF